MRSIFSIECTCPETRFPVRDAAIPSVSLLGSVGVPFSVGEVDELSCSIPFDVGVGLTQMACHSIDLNVSYSMVPLAWSKTAGARCCKPKTKRTSNKALLLASHTRLTTYLPNHVSYSYKPDLIRKSEGRRYCT